MKDKKIKESICNFCGIQETEILQMAEEPFDVVKCLKCGLIYVDPRPKESDLADHYGEDDYYKEWIEKQMPKRLLMWKARIKDLKRYRTKGKILDVGCGLGTFLSLAKKEGFEGEGTEISDYASRYTRETHGLSIFRGELVEARLEVNSFDIVTLWHVFEHLSDPKKNLEEISRILKPGGLLVIAVPNAENFLMQFFYRIIKGRSLKYFSTQDKELHLYHFSQETLKAILEMAGFKVLKIRPQVNRVNFFKEIIDYLGVLIYFLTRRNFAGAIKVYAEKK